MKKAVTVCASLTLFAPMNAIAHEGFFADVGFENWERHCHVYELEGAQECWAVFQERLFKNEKSARGFVIVVHEKQGPLSFELRDINRFGYSVDIQVDDNEPFRLACHASICTPWERDDAKQLIDEMKTGNELHLQSNLLGDRPRPSEEANQIESISLAGFSAILSQ